MEALSLQLTNLPKGNEVKLILGIFHRWEKRRLSFLLHHVLVGLYNK